MSHSDCVQLSEYMDAKARRIIATVERNARLVGVHPDLHPGAVAQLLSLWTDTQWLTVARATDGHTVQRAPSLPTRNAVIVEFVRRAARRASA